MCGEMSLSLLLQARLEQVSKLWQELIDTSATKRQTLIDAHKRAQFLQEADEVAAWISDREAVASAEDLGKDLEHVEMLQKNFADFMKVRIFSQHLRERIFIFCVCYRKSKLVSRG